MAVVTTSQNISQVTFATSETITISNGAKLTIDAQVPSDVTKLDTLLGTIQCITSGELYIKNTSTITPLVVTLSLNTHDYQFKKNGIFRLDGNMIEIGTSTGTFQSFNFNTLPYLTIPFPTYVEVEDSINSGIYMPWLVYNTEISELRTIKYSKNLFGASGENGNIFFWNSLTRELETGNGINGNVISPGRRIRIPNIYIHSNSTTTTQSNRSLINLSSTGRLFAKCVSFSDNIWLGSNSIAGEINLERVGICGTFYTNSMNAPLNIKNLAVNADTQTQDGVGFIVANSFGKSSFERIAVTHSNAIMASNQIVFSLNLCLGVIKIEKIFAMVRERAVSSVKAISLTNTPVSDGFIKDLVAIGGRIDIIDNTDLTLLNPKHTDRISDLQSNVNAQAACVFTRSKNCKIVNLQKAGIASCRSSIVFMDAQSEKIQVFGGDYNLQGNTLINNGVFQSHGASLEVYNFNIGNIATGAIISDTPTTFLASKCIIKNVRGSIIGTAINDGQVNGLLDGVVGKPNDFNTSFPGGTDFNSAHLLSSGDNTTTGHIVFAAFGDTDRNIFSGDGQLNQAGSLEILNTGDSVIFKSLPFTGILNFSTIDPIYSYIQTSRLITATTIAPIGVKIEFAVSTYDESSTSEYYILNTINLPLAITTLTDYNSNDGLIIKLKLTATTTDTTRLINLISWGTVYDNTYIAPDSIITIKGINETDVVKCYLNTKGNYLIDKELYSFTGSGKKKFSATANFLSEVYFVRYNSLGQVIMTTTIEPQILLLGDNGILNLFSGNEIQFAQSSEVAIIKAKVDQIKPNLELINRNIRKASLLIPAMENSIT